MEPSVESQILDQDFGRPLQLVSVDKDQGGSKLDLQTK